MKAANSAAGSAAPGACVGTRGSAKQRELQYPAPKPTQHKSAEPRPAHSGSNHHRQPRPRNVPRHSAALRPSPTSAEAREEGCPMPLSSSAWRSPSALCSRRAPRSTTGRTSTRHVRAAARRRRGAALSWRSQAAPAPAPAPAHFN
jgi:hypothetical protein